MARNPIERALGVWSGTNYRSVMLPGLGVVTCGELCDAITALKAENERLAQERQDSAREWRTAFDSMQQRAIAAERALAERAGGVKHVAYFDDGQFHWMSGIAPRNCELYTRPSERAVTKEMVEAAREIIHGARHVYSDEDLARAALKAAMGAGRHD